MEQEGEDAKYVGKDGRALDLLEWANLLGDREYCRVGLTDVGEFEVSTVWLGLNHRFGPGPGLYYETMVFDKRTRDVLDQEHYHSLHEAVLGHGQMVHKHSHPKQVLPQEGPL